MGFDVRWRSRTWCKTSIIFLIVFTLTEQQDLTPTIAKAFAAPTSENAVEVEGEKKTFFKIGPERRGVQKAILDEVLPMGFGATNNDIDDFGRQQPFDEFGAYDDNVLTDLNREQPIFVPSLYKNETRDAGQATKTPTKPPPTTTPRPTTRPPPPPLPSPTRPPQPPQPFRNVPPQQTFRPQPPHQPFHQPFHPQQQQFQQVQKPFHPQTPQQSQLQQLQRPQQPQFPPQQQQQFQQRPQFPPQQPPHQQFQHVPGFQQQQQFQQHQQFQQQQQQFQQRPQFPPQQFRQPFQPQQQQQNFQQSQQFQQRQPFQQPQQHQNFQQQQFQTPAPQFPQQNQQQFRQPFVPQQPQFANQQQQHFQAQPNFQTPFQTAPQTTTARPQFGSTRGPFRPLRPFRPQPAFNRPRPNDPTGLRTGVCPETIFYEHVPASVFELQAFYSHFAVVVSVDQCARTCHEFNCAAAFFDPRDGHCQFNPATNSQVPPGACPNWPNPLYRNNVPKGAVPIKIFCVTCQRRRRPFRGRGRRPRIQRPKNTRFEPTVIGRTMFNAAHGVVLRQPQAISIGFGPSTSREDWYMGSRSREKSKESLERFGESHEESSKSLDLRSSSERFRKFSQKSPRSSSRERVSTSPAPSLFTLAASSNKYGRNNHDGRINTGSWPTSRLTKSQETRISRGQKMMAPSEVDEEEQDGSWGSDSSHDNSIPSKSGRVLSSHEFRARYLARARGAPTFRQRLPHSSVISTSLSDFSESS